MPTAALDALRQLVGATHVLTGEAAAPYELDWRKRWRGQAWAVVRPGSIDEVVGVLGLCHAHGIAVVPQGGNTGLVGGGVPDASGNQLVVSLRRLNRVRGVDTINCTMTVDAGCVLQQAQEAAERAGLLFPLSLASEGSCTIGGNLATNAGGTQVLRYGNARELCLGLEVVTPDGRLWSDLSGLRKDNTGYHLRDLYIGSEGTLGLITGAVLKLYPRPAARATALAACPDLAAALSLLDTARRKAHDALTGFEVMNRFSLRLVAKHFPHLAQPFEPGPWTVLLELSDPESEAHGAALLEDILTRGFEEGQVTDSVVAQSLQQSHTLWHLRESISLAQSQEGLNIKQDISVPLSSMAGFVATTDQALARAIPGVRLVTFGHLGDGNLHYNVQAPEGEDPAVFLREREGRVNDIVYDAVSRVGGSISAEHGIGQLKRDELRARKSDVALDLMRSIKKALDPAQRMNPGKVL